MCSRVLCNYCRKMAAEICHASLNCSHLELGTQRPRRPRAHSMGCDSGRKMMDGDQHKRLQSICHVNHQNAERESVSRAASVKMLKNQNRRNQRLFITSHLTHHVTSRRFGPHGERPTKTATIITCIKLPFYLLAFHCSETLLFLFVKIQNKGFI